MASDYASIRSDNKFEYGNGIWRFGQGLLANRYDDRSHFIYELLQNAEDALARGGSWNGPRGVRFELSSSALRFAHFGEPFTERDVRAICGIGESTKDLTSIGRFGIGFKSVYAFTDRPEVHSGEENFAVESFVWPAAIPTVDRELEQTVFVLPLRPQDAPARAEITQGLQRVGPRTLLFLRQIEEIAWTVEHGPSGLYLRSKPEPLGDNVRRIHLIGEAEGQPDVEETWLVFSRQAATDEGLIAGHIEIAFSIDEADEPSQWSVQQISSSPLSVFFPTVVPTNLGFLVQGPYRTTPSRDNVPSSDRWNQHLVRETASLLVESLCTLRDQAMLDADALLTLPLDRAKFAEGSMFAPLFDAVKEALSFEPLLPRYGTGHIPATRARLARTQELRELFSPSQLGSFFGANGELAWLSGDITQDRTPALRQYLLRELGVVEVTPETILATLRKATLEAQADDWILKLYEFLNGQPALLKQGRLDTLRLVRLENGTHVTAKANGQAQAFLPSTIQTGFPTVRRAVCATKDSRKLLEALGLTEPDAVDDVVRNVLPKYAKDDVAISNENYQADIGRILTAFGTDSKVQREKLIAALRKSEFLVAVDAGDGSKCLSKPGDVYLATERLKELFAGVADVLLVDDSYSCLRGEDVRDLLEACGATRCLQPMQITSQFTWQERRDMRHAAGCESFSSEEPIADHTLRGLNELLEILPGLACEARVKRASALWEALGDVENRRGTRTLSGNYDWVYYQPRAAVFDAAFVRQLNATEWIPTTNGELQRPEFVVFDRLGWTANPFLLSKIRFKPPIIEALAREVGIEPGVLDLLKKLGVTSEAQLRDRLGIQDKPDTNGTAEPGDVNDAIKDLLGDSPSPTPPVPEPIGPEPTKAGMATGGSGGGGSGSRPGGGSGTADTVSDGTGGKLPGTGGGGRKSSPGGTGAKPFISYVGVQPSEEEPDPDGLEHEARMALEEKAIAFILAREPQLKRTSTHNPGYDLFEEDADEEPTRRVEVKAMTGDLHGRPVGLSRTQFECAREYREAYWLYVVEHAGDAENARIVRIQDPAGKARTFCFDHGWINVADVDKPNAAEGKREGDNDG